MLQAFALDSIYTATGFFTARHNVADMTTHLEVRCIFVVLSLSNVGDNCRPFFVRSIRSSLTVHSA